MGQCSDCGAWNTIEKQAAVFTQRKITSLANAGAAEVQTINDISFESHERIQTPLAELDRVLGGGIVTGSVILVGGNPGIGKSTLLLQVLCSLERERALYVTGEESLQQVALRAERLGYKDCKLRVLASVLL
jgi:DNA repair protein RadA/Sms